MDPSADTPEIRLVVFDLGRVLLRIADDWAHACANAGLPPRPGLVGDISAGTRRRHDPEAERVFHGFETGRVPEDEFFRFTAERAGLRVEEAQRLMDGWLLRCFDGVDALLDELAAQPVRTACLSNTNAHHWRSITDPLHPAFCPVHRLDFPLASQQIGHAKPDAAAYAHVEALADTPGPRILFFDDLTENIAAARQRGWHGVVVERCDNPIPMIRSELSRYGVL